MISSRLLLEHVPTAQSGCGFADWTGTWKVTGRMLSSRLLLEHHNQDRPAPRPALTSRQVYDGFDVLPEQLFLLLGAEFQCIATLHVRAESVSVKPVTPRRPWQSVMTLQL
jgi:hypothetical protein